MLSKASPESFPRSNKSYHERTPSGRQAPGHLLSSRALIPPWARLLLLHRTVDQEAKRRGHRGRSRHSRALPCLEVLAPKGSHTSPGAPGPPRRKAISFSQEQGRYFGAN